VKGLILAGGLGTRLRPLTYTRPKHLLPIANRPHIEHVFDLLLACDVHEVVMLTSYLAGAFESAIEKGSRRGISMEVAHEDEPLGTAGALKNAKRYVGDDTFLAFNGDILTDVDIGPLVRFHRERGAEATILLTPVEDPSAFGVVPTDPDGRVRGFIEKPPRHEAPTNLINAGIYVLEPSVLTHIPEGEPYSAERGLFPELAAAGTMYALATNAYWMDIGTPQKYLQANLDALAGDFSTSAVADPGPGAVLLGEGSSVAESASVAGACLGAGSAIEDGATVRDSVLLPGAVVGARAVVEGSILGQRAKVGPGATSRGETVADDETYG
jgi:mannose-1-phosphate guanylyltransferase